MLKKYKSSREKETNASQNGRRQSVLEKTASAKGVREHDKA